MHNSKSPRPRGGRSKQHEFSCVLILAAVTFVSSCSQSNEDTAPPSASAAKTDLSQFLLQQSQLPKQAEASEVRDESNMGQALLQSIKTSLYAPSECRQGRLDQAYAEQNMTRYGISFTTTSTGGSPLSYLNLATQGGETVDIVRKSFLGKCSSATLTRSDSGRPIDTTTLTSQELLLEKSQSAALKKFKSVLFEQKSEVESNLPGDTSPTRVTARIVGYVQTPRVMVSLQQTAASPQELDKEQFETLLNLAVQRATS